MKIVIKIKMTKLQDTRFEPRCLPNGALFALISYVGDGVGVWWVGGVFMTSISYRLNYKMTALTDTSIL